jgi:hypothetical protein
MVSTGFKNPVGGWTHADLLRRKSRRLAPDHIQFRFCVKNIDITGYTEAGENHYLCPGTAGQIDH